MEPTREKLAQLYKKSPITRHNRHCYSTHGIFKPSKLQRPSLKLKKDLLCRGKRKVPYRKNDEVRKKTPEETEEEERKKKLTDTANKLLSKIKSWNAENSNAGLEKEEETPDKGNESSKCGKADPKPRRIAHTKSLSAIEFVKKVSRKRTANQYDVNKETLRDFQNRIQHKLIEDIMQMPKENLQNMLNDPKINPIMEVKMTRLVRENKPLIAKKLRAMAEDKMKSSGSSQILLDFDKLIDPVVETDLSVLPYELIKEMEKVFQVQFDYSPMDSGRNELVSGEILGSIQEDVNAYECSTDEDEDNAKQEILGVEYGSISEGHTQESEPLPYPSGSIMQKRKVSVSRKPKVNSVTSQTQTESSLKTSAACQTHQSTETASTQTNANFLYGVPLPVEAKDNSFSSLMEEVNSIQNLINKLNEKRFSLFLELARMNSNGNFNCLGNKNFIETVSNGSISLIESLTGIFRVRNYEQSHSNPRIKCNKQRNYARQNRRK